MNNFFSVFYFGLMSKLATIKRVLITVSEISPGSQWTFVSEHFIRLWVPQHKPLTLYYINIFEEKYFEKKFWKYTHTHNTYQLQFPLFPQFKFLPPLPQISSSSVQERAGFQEISSEHSITSYSNTVIVGTNPNNKL